MVYVQIIVTVILAALGWVVAHKFTSARELRNARNTIRIAALTHCYKVFVRSGIDGTLLKRDDDGNIVNGATSVEDAIALIHLHGSQTQFELANKYTKKISATDNGDSTELVNSLRDDIRAMLDEPKLSGLPHYLRVTANNSSNSSSKRTPEKPGAA